MTKSAMQLWKRIRNMNYISAVTGYEYNDFKKVAIELGLWSECCNKVWDKADNNYCPICGDKL